MSEVNSFANCFDSHNPAWGVLSRSYYLFGLNPQTSNGNGPWLDVRALKQFSAHVKGNFGGGNVQLYASNDQDPNQSGDAGEAFGSTLNSAGVIVVTGSFRWVRAVVSGATAPSLTGNLHGAN